MTGYSGGRPQAGLLLGGTAGFGARIIDFNLPHATHDSPPHRIEPGEPEYGRWLSRVYDTWIGADTYTHSVRILEDIVALSVGAHGAVESLGLLPSGIVVVESDGTIEDVDTLKSVAQGAAHLGLNVSITPSTKQPDTRRSGDGRPALRRLPTHASGARCCQCAVAATSRTGTASSVGTATRVGLLPGSRVPDPARPSHTSGTRRIAVQHLVVRHAEPSDAKTVAALIEEIERYYGATMIQPFEERLAQVETALFGTPPMAYCVLAFVDGEAVGLAAYSFLWPAAGSTHSQFLKELYVRPDGRRLGTGTRLMQEVQAIAATRQGCSRVEWMTDRDNDEARVFYRSLGFAEYGGKVNYRINSTSQ